MLSQPMLANGREAANPSLGQHLHSADILISPHQLQQQILALRIQQILPVINAVQEMETVRLGLIEQEWMGRHRKQKKMGNDRRVQWI